MVGDDGRDHRADHGAQAECHRRKALPAPAVGSAQNVPLEDRGLDPGRGRDSAPQGGFGALADRQMRRSIPGRRHRPSHCECRYQVGGFLKSARYAHRPRANVTHHDPILLGMAGVRHDLVTQIFDGQSARRGLSSEASPRNRVQSRSVLAKPTDALCRDAISPPARSCSNWFGASPLAEWPPISG